MYCSLLVLMYHCNKKYGAKGFQIAQAGAGKGKAGSCTDSGFMYLDTTGGTEKITYFTVYDNGSGTAPKTDNVPKLKKCFVENGMVEQYKLHFFQLPDPIV